MRIACLLAVAALAAGCGAGRADVLDAPADGLLAATTTVLESTAHGPELCLGGIAESLPPQCGGVPVIGWSWAAVAGEQSVNGTTWGDFRVVGRYDGQAFTLTRAEPAGPREPDRTDRFAAPCPEPAGGWRATDPSRAGEQGLARASERAARSPEFAGLWVDDRTPVDDVPAGPDELVLVAAFTGELDRHETELREVWGGPLCVVARERTEAELRRVSDELLEERVRAELGLDDVLSSSTDVVRGVVQLGVVVAEPAVQDRLDRRYGAGVVELLPALTPAG